MRNRKLRNTTLAVLGLAMVVGTSGCSRSAPAPDEVTLVYDKGPMSDTAFEQCVAPGTTAWAGPFDQTYTYTAGQITFDFTGGPDAESGPLRFVSQDNQEMEATGVLTIDLNTDCKVLQDFHENIGRRKNMYNVDDNVNGPGWIPGLQTYLGQPLQRALQDAGQKYGWDKLRGDGATRALFEQDIAAALPGLISGATENGAFFVNPKITVNKPQPTNPGLVEQVNQRSAAEARIATIEAQRLAQEAEIGQINQLVDAFGGDWAGYIAYRSQVACEQQKPGCLPFFPLPAGAPVSVPAP